MGPSRVERDEANSHQECYSGYHLEAHLELASAEVLGLWNRKRKKREKKKATPMGYEPASIAVPAAKPLVCDSSDHYFII